MWVVVYWMHLDALLGHYQALDGLKALLAIVNIVNVFVVSIGTTPVLTESKGVPVVAGLGWVALQQTSR